MNDFSTPSIKDHAMTLAHSRLKGHPGMFEMLVHKLATGSPNAAMIFSSVPHWEWVQAVQSSRDFSSIDERILAAIDAWVSCKPTSRSFVWRPKPTEDLTNKEKFARLDMHIAAYSARGSMKPVTPKAAPAVFVTDSNLVMKEAPATVNQVQADPAGPPIDHTLLANPDQLIEAFGVFTGMNKKWFDRWDDKPVLKNANAEKGKKGNAPTPPLFYVFPVMQWLCSPKLKVKGSKHISEATAWRRLKIKFPEVYSAFQDQEPDPMPGK